MARSFDIFRQYQRGALAALAIMAMLAFFVLPPFLQMDAGVGGPDPVAVSWRGGELRESGLERAVMVRRVMNQFLVDTMAASGQDPSRMRLAGGEKDVVDTLTLAREARADGMVVSNTAINTFLSEWTNDLVRPEQFRQIVGRLRERTGVSEAEVFDALRSVLLARRLQALVLGGVDYSGAPPGWRWDYFRRLEQGAKVEVVPIPVESVAAEVEAPTADTLQSFYDRHKDDLPVASSPNPGFRQPYRIRYDALVAKPDVFLEEEKKAVTDEQIAAFYEERKASLFKKPADKPAESPADKPAEKPAAEKPAEPNAAAPAAPAAGSSEAAPVAPPAPGAPTDAPPAGAGEAKAAPASDGAAIERFSVRPVALRRAAEPEAPVAAADAPAAPADATAQPAAAPAPGAAPAAGGTADEAKPAADGEAKPPADDPAQYRPLDEVREEIRERLARGRAGDRVAAIFDAVKKDVDGYSRDLMAWELAPDDQRSGGGPRAPDVVAIAATQGLEGVRSELVSVADAFNAGGIGRSLDQETGARWLDRLFGPRALRLQPVTSIDMAGNRYLSWKTEDQPEFTPAFADARADVERAWRLVHARPLARKRAEEIIRRVAESGGDLAGAVAGREGLTAETVGPFTWLDRGTVPFGSAPVISQPPGLVLPGEAFMRTVFGLEVDGRAVAFNEPQTVCYAIRLVAHEPPADELRPQFLAVSADPRRLATVAQADAQDVYERWVRGVETRQGLAWKRPPRGGD